MFVLSRITRKKRAKLQQIFDMTKFFWQKMKKNFTYVILYRQKIEKFALLFLIICIYTKNVVTLHAVLKKIVKNI